MGQPYLLHIDAVASAAEDETGLHRLGESLGLDGDLFLIFTGEINKVIIFGANQEWDGGFIEATALTVPLLDRVERTLASEIKHKQDCDGVIADKGQHVNKLALTTQIPDREGDFSVAN